MSDKILCENCKNEVMENDDFCPDCGSIFAENVKCFNHEKRDAIGVCIICQSAFCNLCADNDKNVFLCKEHSHFEIIEGMAKVYGTLDDAEANYIKSCLEDENLHPFIFTRKVSPLHMGFSSHSLFRASGESPGNSINELKIMVPAQLVIRAKIILKSILEKN